jgi:DNA-binding NarL/FixJ family response regulator
MISTDRATPRIRRLSLTLETISHAAKKERWPTRILIADDHSAVLDSVVPLLESYFTVVGTVCDGKAAVEAAERLHPDVVVLDISMPLLSGIEAAKQMRKNGSKAPIVFLTVHQDTEILAAARRAGGLGYVVKGRLRADLVLAIRDALEGRDFVSPFQE